MGKQFVFKIGFCNDVLQIYIF